MEAGQFFVSTDGAAIDRIPADISSAEKGNRRKTAANKFLDRRQKSSRDGADRVRTVLRLKWMKVAKMFKLIDSIDDADWRMKMSKFGEPMSTVTRASWLVRWLATCQKVAPLITHCILCTLATMDNLSAGTTCATLIVGQSDADSVHFVNEREINDTSTILWPFPAEKVVTDCLVDFEVDLNVNFSKITPGAPLSRLASWL